ncbi:hypothetical protein D9M69_621420 [compost metagenome]
MDLGASRWLRPVHVRLISQTLHLRLNVIEGSYRLLIEDDQLTLVHEKGRVSQLAREQILAVKEAADFYQVICAGQGRQGERFFILPKYSHEMDAEQYRHGLQLFLQNYPVSPAIS